MCAAVVATGTVPGKSCMSASSKRAVKPVARIQPTSLESASGPGFGERNALSTGASASAGTSGADKWIMHSCKALPDKSGYQVSPKTSSDLEPHAVTDLTTVITLALESGLNKCDPVKLKSAVERTAAYWRSHRNHSDLMHKDLPVKRPLNPHSFRLEMEADLNELEFRDRGTRCRGCHLADLCDPCQDRFRAESYHQMHWTRLECTDCLGKFAAKVRGLEELWKTMYSD